MAFIGISSLSNAISRIFTRNYDVADSSNFRDFFIANLTPAGTVCFLYSEAALPDGWIYAQGQTVSKTTYPDLFAAIGYAVGGSGDNFQIPDLRDKIPIGAGTLAAMGAAAGSLEKTLTVDNLPAHTHTISETTHVHAAGSVVATVPTGITTGGSSDALLRAASNNGDDLEIPTSGNTASAQTNLTAQNTGSGQAVNVLPPVFGLRAIMKA
jgi:microcystin-dependent protein